MSDDRLTDDAARMGPAAERLGLSPRMVRYLEAQGVLHSERGPGPRGHRHFPPHELELGAAAVAAVQAGQPSAALRAIRELAERRVAAALTGDDPLQRFEILALARAVDARLRPPGPDQPGGGPPPPPRRLPPAPHG